MKQNLTEQSVASRTPRKWDWMLTAVFLIGILSIFLLLWVHSLSQKQRVNYLTSHAVMDIRLNASTSHLWLDEALGGDTTADRALADMDRAIHLVNVALNGGELDHGLIAEPVKDPALRAELEALQSMLLAFRTLSSATLQERGKPGSPAYDEQIDVLFKGIYLKAKTLDDLIEKNSAEYRATSERLFLAILAVWTFVVIGTMTGLWNRELRRKRAVQALLEANEQLLSAQAELVRKEKLVVLGQVAGSLSHELRNPLGVMNNAVYYLKTTLTDADTTTREYLDIIADEIVGAERIVSELLESVRTKSPRRQIVSVEDLIPETLRRCRVPERVQVNVELSPGLPPIEVDPQQIQQVLRNVITNGIDAIAGAGSLTINAVEDHHGGMVRVSVRDTGAGLAPEQMAKLFQPLHTTKARGIGLGLVVVKKLTEANGGSVDVQSEPGKGTTFTLALPSGTRIKEAA